MMNRARLIYQLLFLLVVFFAGAYSSSAQDTATDRRRVFKIVQNDPVKAEPAPARWGTTAYIEKEIFNLINSERQKKGLKLLTWNDRIANLARRHSRDMADNRYFGHQERDGSIVSNRADKANIKWVGIAENIVWFTGAIDPASYAAESWMASHAHRENILTKGWRQTGIGAIVGPDGSYYVTQVFLY